MTGWRQHDTGRRNERPLSGRLRSALNDRSGARSSRRRAFGIAQAPDGVDHLGWPSAGTFRTDLETKHAPKGDCHMFLIRSTF